MKKLVILLLIVLVACAPALPEPEVKEEPKMDKQPVSVITQEEVSKKSVKEEEVIPPTPVVSKPVRSYIEPYSQLGCEQMLTEEDFAQVCEQDANNLVVTYKIGTNNCFVNVKDRLNERLTAGITLTAFDSAADAMKEFERRLKVLMVGADRSIGERAYTFPKVDRETVNFVRNEFIVEVGSDTRLCSKEGLEAVARIIDGHIE